MRATVCASRYPIRLRNLPPSCCAVGSCSFSVDAPVIQSGSFSENPHPKRDKRGGKGEGKAGSVLPGLCVLRLLLLRRHVTPVRV